LWNDWAKAICDEMNRKVKDKTIILILLIINPYVNLYILIYLNLSISQ